MGKGERAINDRDAVNDALAASLVELTPTLEPLPPTKTLFFELVS